MLLKFKRLIGLILMMAVVRQAAAFSIWGPAESWQTPTLDYVIKAPEIFTSAFRSSGGTELGGPKNLGDEYRINCSTVTYAFDFTFLDYFGSNGVKAVDQAMAVFNKLPRVSSASADLSEFITEGNQRINQDAEAVFLLDLKSTTMTVIMEHLGLLGESHIFDLRARVPQPGAPACSFDYLVLNWNFDPMTFQPTHYVNGTQYGYNIVDLCPAKTVADAVEYTIDAAGFPFSAVATPQGEFVGGYYLGLSRDDVGGLRYLYRHNNYNNETLPPGAFSSGLGSSVFNPINFLVTNSVVSNSVALRGGVEKINFVKVHFDSFLGTSFNPITLKYTLPLVANFTVKSENITRTLTRPDIIFGAADLSEDTVFSPNENGLLRNVRFVTNGVVTPSGANTPGPGVIDPQMEVIFNKAGPVRHNASQFFLTDFTGFNEFQWGSFDGSTNDPIVYPSGMSIRQLEQQVAEGGLTAPPTGVFNPAGF